MKRIKKKKGDNIPKKLPFIIHGDPNGGYPTHTHGLDEIGFPEILIDPRAFGIPGNGGAINDVWSFLKKPQNSSKLEFIKGGRTVKISTKEFFPEENEDESCTLCLRRVTGEFEGVKMAYLGDTPKNAWLIQIYVEGDDFALTDEYYLEGIPF